MGDAANKQFEASVTASTLEAVVQRRQSLFRQGATALPPSLASRDARFQTHVREDGAC